MVERQAARVVAAPASLGQPMRVSADGGHPTPRVHRLTKGRFMSLSVREYLDRARDQTIPPLVLELILRSGKSFYIKSVFAVDDKAEMVPLRVWDLRALAQADLDTVLRRLGAVQSRDELENIERLHPK